VRGELAELEVFCKLEMEGIRLTLCLCPLPRGDFDANSMEAPEMSNVAGGGVLPLSMIKSSSSLRKEMKKRKKKEQKEKKIARKTTFRFHT
jgi:hypothetical protein